MGEFKLLNVGVIKGDDLEVYYQVMMEFDGQPYSLELNFRKKTIEESKQGKLKNFVFNLEKYEAANREVLEDDFSNNGQVHSYIDFNCNRFGLDALARQFGLDAQASDFKLQLLKHLKLIRVGVYPDGQYHTPYYATFDYVLNGELSYQIIAIKTSDEGAFESLSWER
ncbi:DUF2004 domain-containing protein [Flavobacterium sp. NKUCC04_CG]|uniref:DUF2004 domain-containing protein n=1 Tax=Flavobacterium sp. NKUCC04_CG TaxID=2842121 RepID=UPI001C5A770A|nr:DUF2004 domain-containing protein [Flavobacterium sp. NKUCC04_CG]MBW3519161.1 DUF2004 domain-containing protein [Flavobacterium sp. NKUCC04_CG]